MSNTLKTIGKRDLIIFCVTAIFALRWCPITAQYGGVLIFLWVTASVMFFVPFSLIISELCCIYPDKRGGLVQWIKSEYGEMIGFVVSVCYFISCLLAIPMALTFSACSLAEAFFPALTNSKLYLNIFIIVVFGAAVLINCVGIDKVKKVINVIGPLGVVLPAVIVVVLAFGSVFLFGKPAATNYRHNLIPHLNFDQLMFLSILAFAMAGIEMISAFTYKIKNPKKTMPLAILISSVMIAFLYIVVSASINLVIPADKINILTAFVQVLSVGFHYDFLAKIVGLLIALGGVAFAMVWVLGPVKIFIEGNAKAILPKFLIDENGKNDVPRKALVLEFVIVMLICLLTCTIPKFESIYTMLIQMMAITYFIPYLVIVSIYFIERKRIDFSKQVDYFRIPGKTNFLAYTCGCIAFFTLVVSLILCFLPPPHITACSDKIFYVSELVVANVVLFGASYFYYIHKKKMLTKHHHGTKIVSG